MSPPATIDDAEARAALERSADQLFYNRGIPAVSMADLRDASGVSLRRLYSICPSKADVVSLWLRARHKTWTAGFTAAVEANLAAADNVVDAVFDALSSWMVETNFRGCGFINTYADPSDRTAEHLEIIQHHKQAVAQYLSTLSPHGDLLALLVDGAIVQAAIFSSVQPINLARQAALVVVEARQPTSERS